MSLAPGPIAQQITFLDTRDLGRTADFYERILGPRLARDQGACRIYHVSGNAYIGFCERAAAPAPPAGLTLTLITDDVDEWCRRLRAHGVEFVKEPADNSPYRIYNAFVRDPNGYRVEIQDGLGAEIRDQALGDEAILRHAVAVRRAGDAVAEGEPQPKRREEGGEHRVSVPAQRAAGTRLTRAD